MSQHELLPASVYIKNFLALSTLMVLTIVAYYIPFGSAALGLTIALLIACAKASLIILIFMNVKYSSHLTMIFAASGFFWFLILISFFMADFVFADKGSAVMNFLPDWQPPF